MENRAPALSESAIQALVQEAEAGMDFSHAQPQANPHYTGPHFSEHVWAQLNARALREGKHPYGIVEEIVSEYFAVPGSTL